MKTLFTLLISISTFVLASNNQKVIQLKKITTPIVVDGVIDDAWEKTNAVADFFQLTPYYGKEPSRNTYAKVVSTENSLYCLIVCNDEYENIQKQTGRQDDQGGDIVSIMLDTFGDKQTAYKFAVTASGVRADSRMLDDARNRDYSWDGIWFSASKIYNWGFVVEIEIPYKSIQYDETLTEWGIDFDRWRPLNNEDLYWCQYSQDEGQRISKFGKLLFSEFRPTVKGLNLEMYPVAFGKVNYIGNNKYKIDPNAGIDIFYNPSPQITLQATANPDFAQIEADPYDFNISRYESYFNERRPFFIQGNEIFKPSGAERNSGFYRPLDLFYSRRIGKKLDDGSEVPITFGTKAFGRSGDWEYGGFLARTAETEYQSFSGKTEVEPSALFFTGRIKKQILDNSSLGVLLIGKQSNDTTYGVIDIDGAFRGSNWQLAYQIARSVKNNQGDYAFSAGYKSFSDTWFTAARGRYIGEDFNADEVGFVPWKGTGEFVALTGPRWYFKEGTISSVMIYTGPYFSYEKVDGFTDYAGLFGLNVQFRNNLGFEININSGKAKDNKIEYGFYSFSYSMWTSQAAWNANIYGNVNKTYNFMRDYLATYADVGGSFTWNILPVLKIGTSFGMWIEGNPEGDIEDITYNARPSFSYTPVNDLTISLYVDNTFVRSTNKMERIFVGALFAYQFSPKSWIYFALNENHDRFNPQREMKMTDRVGVFKVKYLYYL